jgi:hypothetical protein
MMSRYKGRTSPETIERDFPHIVEIAVPANGLGRRLDAMHEWHIARGISARHGQQRHVEDCNYIRWCFADAETANLFAEHFGGTALGIFIST